MKSRHCDVWFFLHKNTGINPHIIQLRTGLDVTDYAILCAERVRNTSPKTLVQGLGELLDGNVTKSFVKNSMIEETASLLELFSLSPIIAGQPVTERMQLIDTHPEILEKLEKNDIDISIVSAKQLLQIIREHATVEIPNRKGNQVTFSL